MAGRGDAPYKVALQGFSEFERGALSSFFRLAATRAPAATAHTYTQVARLEESDFIVADADDAASLRGSLALDRAEDTVYIGRTQPLGALHWLARPIEPTRILRALDAIVSQRTAPPVLLSELSLSAVPAPPVLSVPPAARPVRPPVASNAPVAAGDLPSIAGFVDDDATGPDVLVADDSRIARRFMQVRLQRLGYRVHLASDGDEVLELLTQQRFSLVFLDITLGSAESLDGLAICQHLKQHPDHAGPDAPRVLMVTGLSGATDRVRGTLAGCDAYLTKPLVEADLLKALHGLDPGLAERRRALAR